MTAKQQHLFLDYGIKSEAFASFLYVLPRPDIESLQATKKGNDEGSMGSKSKYRTMKSSQNIQKGNGTKKNKKCLLDTGKENTPDIISKSLLK